MPRNGSGSYSLPNGPFVPSTVISSTVMNQNLSDLGTALTQSLANDGQTTPVANLPMATFRHTNVGNAAARNEYAAAGQVQDSSLQWLTSVAGTDTITASIAPGPTAYTAGQTFRFVAAGANTTTAVTLNINGLGAKNVTKRGAVALAAGDIRTGQVVQVVYDGTQFQMQSIAGAGSLIGIRVFSSVGATTYTPTSGTNSVYVMVQAGGGAGGGTAVTGASQTAIGGSGGSGAYAEGYYTSSFSGVTVTVGAGGSGVSGGATGGSGGASSFGALISCPGGDGGLGSVAGAPPRVLRGGSNTAAPTGSGIIVSTPGSPGNFSLALDATGQFVGAPGSASRFGAGGGASANTGGANATGFGSGGGGVAMGQGQAAVPGGNGRQGIVIVYEYA